MFEPVQETFTEKDEKTKIENINSENQQDDGKIDNKNDNDQSIAQNEIQEYIQKSKEIYENFIKFLENSDKSKKYLQNLNTIFSQRQEEDKLEIFLQLISSFSNNCHRYESLFKKIYQMIEYYEIQIKQTFSNIEIFNIFKDNKKILLFLFKKGIITINDTISNELLSKTEPNGNRYCHFFYPEIKKFVDTEKVKTIEKELLEKDPDIFENFEEKREEGENDTFICSLIRKDSVEEFIQYVNRKNISLNSEIIPSIFETNSFLNENENTTLIEYAAFFGSIQIFHYLFLNKVEINPSLWLYIIHSRNAELFHFPESNKVPPPKFNINEEEEEKNDSKTNNYLKCFCESIKCHHNEISEYIENNMLTQNNDELRKNEKVLSSILQFHNYAFFPSDFENVDYFYYLCSYNYHKLVDLFIHMKSESIKKMISEEIHIFIYFIKSHYKKQRMKIKLKLFIFYY